MEIAIPVTPPFSFEQTLAFLGRFPPCRGDYVLATSSVTAAVAVRGAAHAFTLRGTGERVVLEVDDGAPVAAIAAAASDLLGARDDLAPFYAAAEADPMFLPIARELRGLHHVRFMSLADIAVYSVMMQRTPVRTSAALRRRFVERFGWAASRGGHTVRAMPELAAVTALTGQDIGEAIGHARKGEQIAVVARGVAALGEAFLRTAPYETARDALLSIPHVGPFSAAAILLRGLGRMDELPWMAQFEEQARAAYGERVDVEAIRRHYGRSIGYWSYYLMVADRAGRGPRRERRPLPDRPRHSRRGARANMRTSAA
ncbi:MAG: hypothetical protein KF773_11920 [Deltaproteobacteria bacterium]|nr:hypothetical protein [Deltaproteobacteria bacterium]